MSKTRRFLMCCMIVTTVLFSSCGESDGGIDSNVKHSFKIWAKGNIDGRYKITSIKYDTVGVPFDYIYKGYMLNQTVGSSGKSESEGNIASQLISLYGVLDSTYLTTDIIVAKINVKLKENDKMFYIGMRGDSVCTMPKQHAYEALTETHNEGEQKMYEAVREINTNLNSYAKSNLNIHINENESDDEFYTFWINLPGYEETMKAIGRY